MWIAWLYFSSDDCANCRPLQHKNVIVPFLKLLYSIITTNSKCNVVDGFARGFFISSLTDVDLWKIHKYFAYICYLYTISCDSIYCRVGRWNLNAQFNYTVDAAVTNEALITFIRQLLKIFHSNVTAGWHTLRSGFSIFSATRSFSTWSSVDIWNNLWMD